MQMINLVFAPRATMPGLSRPTTVTIYQLAIIAPVRTQWFIQ